MSEPNLMDNNTVTPSDNPNNNVEVNQNTTVPKDGSSDVSVSSGASSASSRSTVSKQSGIRPPSRIGRPCAGIQKPAIPATPTKNSSDDSIRRLTDDYGRHKLSDLMEADESEEDGLEFLRSSSRRNRYTSIGSTASSMDGLWELHPRRLSEAGLSRHSDSSAVLTEDTDSFIIGQRVWVGGTKPGTIAFIGETQFAPGEWAGIALDEPIGKNDGSVGGIKYFQCESKKGVFSRLTRLTRVPLEQPGMGSNETFTSPSNGVRRSPISPTGSTRSLLRSAASLSNSNTSINSAATHVDFKIGDRVIIRSNQGSKIGTVRYMGLTDFAPGEWVGVELDDPRGKNDGSVEGKSYFECRPNFGLFAPISKVSKSPSKHRPSACVVHSGPGLPPSGLKRANSKESMASMTSAASSVRRVRLGVTSLTPKKVPPKTATPIPTRTALQDVLREKQQHIEQLLKERDLERAEITRAASQADEAEQRFFSLKQDFEQYRSECETKVRENGDLLASLKLDQTKLLAQLEEEKRRNEDLEFKFEEAAITKGDIEANVVSQKVVNEAFIKKIEELEKALTEERLKSEAAELTSNKLFEAEENLFKSREAIELLKSELDEARKKRETTEQEKSSASSLVDSLQQQIQSASSEIQEKNVVLAQLNEEISKIQAENDVFKRQTSELKEQSTNSCEEKDAVIAELSQEVLRQLSVIEEYKTKQDELVKENERLKMELSAKAHDYETVNDRFTAKEVEVRSIQDELDVVKREVSEKTDHLERHKSNAAEVEEALRNELRETREALKTKISEVEDVKKEWNIQVSQKDQELEEKHKTITERSAEIEKLNGELSALKTNFDEIQKDAQDRHARHTDQQAAHLLELKNELQMKIEELAKSALLLNKYEEDICANNQMVDDLKLQLQQAHAQLMQYVQSSTAFNQQVNDYTVKTGDLERQLVASNQQIVELQSLNAGLQSEVKALSAQCQTALPLEQLRAELQEKQNLLITLRADYEQKIQVIEKQRHMLEVQHNSKCSEFEGLQRNLEEKLQLSLQTEAALRERCEKTVNELTVVRNEYAAKISQLEFSLREKEQALATLNAQCEDHTRRYEDQLKSVTTQLTGDQQNNQQQLSTLTQELVILKQQISEKTEQLIVAQAEASRTTAQCQQLEREYQQKFTDDLRRLEFELNEKTAYIQKVETELALVKRDCQTFNVDIDGKNGQIGDLSAEVQRAQAVISQLQEQLAVAQSSCNEQMQQGLQTQTQCQGLVEQVATLTAQVHTSEEVYRNLQIEHNNAMMLVNKLRITEQQKQECLKLLQQEASLTAEQKNCEHVRALLGQIKIDDNSANTQTILELQRQVEVVKNDLAQRNYQFDQQKAELLRLQEEMLKMQDCRGGPTGPGHLVQDKDLAENQIRFLNSIIVDIQKKNEEQRARIEILEAGYSPAMADDLKVLEHRQPAPRMYCDICEEFDLHETEDCPQQNSDVVPQSVGPVKDANRPYCDICEVFGHSTEDCQEELTF